MITLKTGVIGAGKTLSAVAEIAKLQARWEKHENEWREVFAFGVRDLALPHKPLQAYPVGGKPGDPIPYDELGQPTCDIVPMWETVPPGSIVIIDEAHRAFPPAGSGRPASHIAWLDMSRQAGIDIILITQHPRKLHIYARTSVNKHQHYRRAFGGSRSIVYEWDECSLTLSYKTATKGLFNYPADAYKYYKSAQEHTKISFAVPAWVVVPIAGILIGIVALPKAYSALSGAATGKGITEAAPASPSASSVSSPATAKAPESVEDAASSPPKLAGCIQGPRGGFCLDVNGQRVDMPPDVLAWNTRNLGGFVPYDMSKTSGSVRAADVPASAPVFVSAGGFAESSIVPRRDVVRPLTGGLYSGGAASQESADSADGRMLAAMRGGDAR